MTDIKFPVSMPGPTERLINPDGTASPSFQSFLESWVNANGGQGGTAIYDAALLASQAEQLAVVEKRLQGAQQDIEAIRSQSELADARVAGQLKALASEVEGARAQADLAENRIIGRGSIARFAVDQINAIEGFSGIVAIAESSSTNWYTGGGTPTKAATQYDTITLTTPDFEVSGGERLEVSIAYKMVGKKDMFEHWSHDEVVQVQQDSGAAISTLSDYPFVFACAGNTGAIPNSYSTGEEVVFRHAEAFVVDVPTTLSGSWPSDGLIRVRLSLSPSTAVSGGTDAIVGTWTAADVATNFKVENARVMVRVRPKSLNSFVG